MPFYSRRWAQIKKIEENKSVLELNFTLKSKWAGHNFDFEYLTKPYYAAKKEIK